MELDEFCQDDFDVKRWVNEQVRSSTALAEAAGHVKGSNVDDHLATLVVKLQLLSQSTNKSIDDSAVKLLSELPKVKDLNFQASHLTCLLQAMIDIQRVGSDAELLAHQMAQVRSAPSSAGVDACCEGARQGVGGREERAADSRGLGYLGCDQDEDGGEGMKEV